MQKWVDGARLSGRCISMPDKTRSECRLSTLLSNIEPFRSVCVIVMAAEEFTEDRIVPRMCGSVDVAGLGVLRKVLRTLTVSSHLSA